MIKRNLLLAIIAVLAMSGTSQSAKAQDYYETKHDLAFSYGLCANSQVLGFTGDVLGTLFTGGHLTYDNNNHIGPIAAEYFCHTSKVVSVGAIGAYTRHSKDVYYNNEKRGTTTSNYVSLIPAVKIDWLRRENIGLYSKLGVGASFEMQHNVTVEGKKDDNNEVYVTWQASLIGFEAGNSNVRGFIELGCGEQGVALAGVRCKF